MACSSICKSRKQGKGLEGRKQNTSPVLSCFPFFQGLQNSLPFPTPCQVQASWRLWVPAHPGRAVPAGTFAHVCDTTVAFPWLYESSSGVFSQKVSNPNVPQAQSTGKPRQCFEEKGNSLLRPFLLASSDVQWTFTGGMGTLCDRQNQRSSRRGLWLGGPAANHKTRSCPAPCFISQASAMLWMASKSISHHPGNPRMVRFPCKYQQKMVSNGFNVVQDFVHPL